MLQLCEKPEYQLRCEVCKFFISGISTILVSKVDMQQPMLQKAYEHLIKNNKKIFTRHSLFMHIIYFVIYDPVDPVKSRYTHDKRML